ncbi:1-aminocyclopropane-1-carboxylate deaminase/D-cysteine desulfhydrase [Enterovibrio sp. ZSDZ35]|uniref:1-aminocyclopropane-1-carboxylate deaminase/D-cysteine desulfhydrase n=1 Tax=Enterovibrio qingdaonensis TaxID=2899818 RepID=A0ABT5QI33_9GAMM|nr:1-aminocyclopropane-1-carboxylate deaminase/D-cysteine desulfhydrase [Enterovibrio sp. ZSDZ35]MDD1780514.1 1-aminocyclopropane-1-carboxylate deaminase/D-cysteine desulfhydrase [Enterovibrio sp. ZSDZ35]
MKIAHTPVTAHSYSSHSFYLKRDDMLHPYFSGNKARKLMSLLTYEDPSVTHLIGYGSPQANSLLSLAALANIKGWQLEFYVDRIPAWLQQHPIGNYRLALELGARVIPVSTVCEHNLHPESYIQTHRLDDHCLYVPEGGRSLIAEEGVAKLADEIADWAQEQAIEHLVVALPSGTGTTALFLHKHLQPKGIEVITCACVGGKDYLIKQFEMLGEQCFPTILDPNRNHHFGKLYQDDYEIWQALKEKTGVEFDLLYDPLMWHCLLDWLPQHPDKSLLYVHQGGLVGNESMLPRYRRKFDV